MNQKTDETPTRGPKNPVEVVGGVVEKRVKPKREVRCTNCGYVWDTTTQLLWVTCPNCRKNCSVSKCLIEEPAVTTSG